MSVCSGLNSSSSSSSQRSSRSAESEVAMQQRLAMLMQQLVKLTNRLEELSKGPQGTPMWRKRAGRMRRYREVSGSVLGVLVLKKKRSD